MEVLWKPTYQGPNGAIESNHSIFVHVMHELYGAPCGLDQYMNNMGEGQYGVMFQNRWTQLLQIGD